MSSHTLAGIAIALLAIMNIFLFYELTSIEALARRSITLPSKLDLTSLRNDPSTHEDWLKFTEKLIEFDDIETESWISDVQDTVNLLLKVEDILKNLTNRIPLEVKHKALLRSMKKISPETNSK
ncbi:hypothetical protein J437_LFUL004505 [Ladona fulva]|uniref:Uncharacterized protein n=1 Tax=Ladona fulva TaxID=123851 RepID=A0A8K0KA61_LADFU|nr:hypothetical protein J437_LFUL004505 [Ladona fulva]